MEQDVDAPATLLELILKAFPNKGIQNAHSKVNFSSWKLNELKEFLRLTKNYRGLSKAKKTDIICKAINVWKKISENAMFSGGNNDISDQDLLSLDLRSASSSTVSCFLSPPGSPPSNFPVPSTSLAADDKCKSSKIVYPDVVKGMSTNDFKKWTVPQLSQYLADRCINMSGNKDKLVENVFGAYVQQLPITYTDPQQEKEQIQTELKAKLCLENGMVTLPNPTSIVDDWIAAPTNLPDTTFSHVENYLKTNDAGKAFQGGRSLLMSGHVKNIMTHMLSPNVRYCFVRGLCHPEQKLSKQP